MGHANVDTTLNAATETNRIVYTQVLDGSLREAVEKSAVNCSQTGAEGIGTAA
jgi:hypothetical protein